MIKPAYECDRMSDDEFDQYVSKHVNEVRDYIDNTLVYDFFSFFIANAYNNDCLWDDYRLDYEYTNASGDLTILPKYSDLDIEKLNKILKEKYSLKITSTIPLKIEKI